MFTSLFSLSPLSSAPMIDPSRLENVLPACLYSPTYVVKDFPIARYQGLQFVSHFSITFSLDRKKTCHSVCVTMCLCVSMCESGFLRSSEVHPIMAVVFLICKKQSQHDIQINWAENKRAEKLSPCWCASLPLYQNT